MTAKTKHDAVEPNRDQRIHFRVTEEEKNAIEAKSRAAGFKKVSDYLRVIGMGAEIKQLLPPELRRQLVGIGINLNQLTRMAQADKAFRSYEEQLVQALAVIRSYLV
ncbi:hypothetical protein I2I05_20945 [Hymenobacter sp. BT683]|uniref:MobC family plasmid mobilization relaxosome protein n=1 Tax=Hymenobacter jeongseonensis TaxID=2791027 RepID=A0ABS0INE6_9BACT|nr:hypothetical protein [Hymenobacter jeongseonensis]MBF9239872.1 hypothetical protein [Hymenobacter jeongseonensis]